MSDTIQLFAILGYLSFAIGAKHNKYFSKFSFLYAGVFSGLAFYESFFSENKLYASIAVLGIASYLEHTEGTGRFEEFFFVATLPMMILLEAMGFSGHTLDAIVGLFVVFGLLDGYWKNVRNRTSEAPHS